MRTPRRPKRRHAVSLPSAGTAVASGVDGLPSIVKGLEYVVSRPFTETYNAACAAMAFASVIDAATPDALRGRVSSVNMVFIGASNQLGDVESGFLAALVGAPVTVLFGAGVCLAVTGLFAWRIPELRDWRPPAR